MSDLSPFSREERSAPGDRQGVDGASPSHEGVANRIDPESCADAREGIGEALTGERIGQNPLFPDLPPLERLKNGPIHPKLCLKTSFSGSKGISLK